MKKMINKLAVVLSVVMMMISLVSTDVAAASQMTITNNNDGTIKLVYTNNTNTRVKIKVSKTNAVYYEMAAGKNEVIIPLAEGNGTYTIKCFVNTTGNSYKSVETQSVTNNAKDETEVFLKSSMVVKFDNEAAAVKKAAELTKNAKTEQEKVNAIYNYVVNNFSYDYNKINSISGTAYVSNANDTLNAKKGICIDISTMMAVMLRSVGVKTKVVTGTCTKVKAYHAWNEIYNSTTKTWTIVDATRDMQYREKKMSYSYAKSASEYPTIKTVY